MKNNSTATNNVIPFQFEARQVRTLLIDDQPWFCVADICRVLGYVNSRDALAKHCREKGVAKRDTLTTKGKQALTFINEGNLYRLILKSRKEEAQRFEAWVCDEVLPTIRKHGRYEDRSGSMATVLGSTIGTNGFNMLGAVIKGKVAHLPKEVRRRATMKVWSQAHTAFGVRSAQDIPAEQLDAARSFVAAYVIDGEYLPKPESENLLDDSLIMNIGALITHAQWIRKIYDHYGLYAWFEKVESPVGVQLHDHVGDGACVASMLERRLKPEIERVRAEARAICERSTARISA